MLDTEFAKKVGVQDLRSLDFDHPPRVLVLAPHPDDFDAIAVTLRHLHAQGAMLHVAVLTSGASGVEDGFQGARDDATKAALREQEQAASVAHFGLSPAQLEFVRLPLDAGGNPALNDENRQQIITLLQTHQPDIACMPHGNDSNVTHQRVYALFKAAALALGRPLHALLNQDAKTRTMRHDLCLPFDADRAAWKAELLRLHVSQHSRNLNTRGHGFDERVLQVNRASAAALGLAEPYAEVFELESICP